MEDAGRLRHAARAAQERPHVRHGDAPSTVADYEAFVAGRPDHERRELIDGVAEMMTNPLRRTGEGWLLSELVHPSDRLVFDALGVGMDFAAVDDGVPVLRAVASDHDDPAIPIP